MVEFKACPRCKGDMARGRDMYGEYIQCFQCRHVINFEPERATFSISPGHHKPGRPKKHKAKQPAA